MGGRVINSVRPRGPRDLRGLALRALERVSLLRPAYRAYQVVRALRTDNGRESSDGLALPPARLRIAVAGTPDAEWFLASGRQQAEMIVEALERHGTSLTDVERLLDFGCGCGRVTRHWAELEGPEIYGSDYNRGLVRWCTSNLRFASFSVNGLAPPLDYPSEFFGVVYGISVLTHLSETLQDEWIEELSRVLKPGGLMLLTTHGAAYADRLIPEEQARFAAGDMVVRWAGVAGTNLCTAFHPEAYVRERLAPQLELLELVPEGGVVGSLPHDLVVFRKPSGPSDRP